MTYGKDNLKFLKLTYSELHKELLKLYKIVIYTASNYCFIGTTDARVACSYVFARPFSS